MMRSMFSGVSGLRVHQTRMDVIGNNISNVNTIGYKSQRTTFSDVFSQTLSGATSANDDTGRGGRNAMQVGLGVNISSIDLKMTQGSTQRTDRPFDMLVEGDGFLIVGDASGRYYTRAGALRIDDYGNLTIPNGMIVQGWPADENDHIESQEVQDINLFSPRYASTDPKPTTKAELSGNISATMTGVDNKPPSLQATIGMYDTLGNYYTMPVQLTRETVTTPAPADDTSVAVQWSLKMLETTKYNADKREDEPGYFITDAAGNPIKVTNPEKINFTLNFNRQGLLVDGAAIANSTPAVNGKIQMPALTGVLSGGGQFSSSGIELDVSGLTQYATRSTVKGKATNGNSAGTLKGYSVGSDGIISGVYTNGDLRSIAQIPVAEFDNPSGLEKQGDNIYAMTSNSGEFDGIGQAGVFSTGVLEMSNVDLAEEFTDMIITQRGFQANSKTITTSDEMLQELVGLKR